MKELVERFGESRISIIDIDGEKWIRASDCAKVLDYKNYRSTVSNFVETNKELLEGGVQKLYTPSKSGDQETWYFNDRGLIAFLIKTNQPKAIQFQKWAVGVLSREVKKEAMDWTLRTKAINWKKFVQMPRLPNDPMERKWQKKSRCVLMNLWLQTLLK